ncbi:MAG: hypothetical protein US98_C0003G0010 [Parcubacteria group bacterium GW2011_GWC1_38_6]|nr:MAG: hypothetical protein US98_C0003G0010 [Parcubacteria group bacterium GW2011_GWC1_38_6]
MNSIPNNQKEAFVSILNRFLASPVPLLILGSIISAIYFRIMKLSGNIFQKDPYIFLDLYPQKSLEAAFYIWLIFFLVGIAIWIANQQIIRSSIGKNHWIIVGTFFLIFSGILIMTNPFFSQDIFWNLSHGKILTQYHQNPYTTTPENFPEDPDLNSLFWKDFPMTHGPIWMFLISIPVMVFPHSLALQLFTIRIILFLAMILFIYLAINITKKINPNKTFLTFLALSWQPLILINTINDAHNDILIGGGILIGLYLISKLEYIKGFIWLWLIVLIKYVAILLIPLGMMLLFKNHGWKKTIKIGLEASLIFLLLTLIFYAPFGYNKNIFAGLSKQAHLFNYETLSPLQSLLATTGFSLAGIKGKDILQDRNKPQQSILSFNTKQPYGLIASATKALSILLFALGYLWLILKLSYRDQNFLKKGWYVIMLFVVSIPSWFMNWYLIWLTPLATILGFQSIIIMLGFGLITYPYPYTPNTLLIFLIGVISYLFISIKRAMRL